MINAIDTFCKLEKGVLKLLKAADIYAMHMVSHYQKTEIDKKLIYNIIFENKMSGLNLFGWEYQDNILNDLKVSEHLTQICQQIVLATYTILEVYLIEKFKEYYAYRMNGMDESFIQGNLKRYLFRSLKEVGKHYYEILGIHIPSFELERYFSDNSSHFKPANSWEALLLGSAKK